jgi:hypothetical protein
VSGPVAEEQVVAAIRGQLRGAELALEAGRVLPVQVVADLQILIRF